MYTTTNYPIHAVPRLHQAECVQLSLEKREDSPQEKQRVANSAEDAGTTEARTQWGVDGKSRLVEACEASGRKSQFTV